MTTDYPEQFSRQMGMTHEEFMRTLPAAVSPLSVHAHPGGVVLRHPAGEIRIDLQPGPERRIAALRLPVLLVSFRFSGLDRAQRATFMERFDLAFHRGGG